MSDPNTIVVTSRMRRLRLLKMGYNSVNGSQRIPAIRMAGAYLNDLGFSADGYFQMIVNDDLSLTIKPISKADGDRMRLTGVVKDEQTEQAN